MKLAVKNSVKGALFATAAGAMVLAGAGVGSAHHNPAVGGYPTVDNQVCGVVQNAAGVGLHNLPFGTVPPVATTTVVVTGTLSGSSGWTDSTTTDDKGGWCLTGDATMADEVQKGEHVTLTAEYTTPSGTVTKPWLTSGGSPNIDKWTFFAHGVWLTGPLPTSAAWFDFTF